MHIYFTYLAGRWIVWNSYTIFLPFRLLFGVSARAPKTDSFNLEILIIMNTAHHYLSLILHATDSHRFLVLVCTLTLHLYEVMVNTTIYKK